MFFYSSTLKIKPKRSGLKVVSRSGNQKKEPKHNRLLGVLLFLGVLIVGGYLASKSKPSPIITTIDGDIVLSPEREAKLVKELDEIENAQQYVLRASASKIYPCYSCINGSKTIFLNLGEVWKYGVTRKGEAIRYPGGNYGASDLIYIIQFQGDYGNCLKMEKTRIYNYPLLPEALARYIKLIRPPGNLNDN